MTNVDKTKCPKCGASPCYISLNNDVECSDPECECYSSSLYPLDSSTSIFDINALDADSELLKNLTDEEIEKFLENIKEDLNQIEVDIPDKMI